MYTLYMFHDCITAFRMEDKQEFPGSLTAYYNKDLT